MSSDAKIAANRANAKKSTGPRTAAGKAASSRNNTRHGLTAKLFLLDTEDPAQYEALRSDLIDSYRPANAAELMLVEEIAQNFWRLQRARHIEADNMNAGAPLSHPLIKFGCSPGALRQHPPLYDSHRTRLASRHAATREHAENPSAPDCEVKSRNRSRTGRRAQPTASTEPKQPQPSDTQRPFVVPAERSESKPVDPAQPPGH